MNIILNSNPVINMQLMISIINHININIIFHYATPPNYN